MAYDWRVERDFRDAMIPEDILTKTIEWIKEHLQPDDVFTDEALEIWANSHGMVEPDEDNTK